MTTSAEATAASKQSEEPRVTNNNDMEMDGDKVLPRALKRTQASPDTTKDPASLNLLWAMELLTLKYELPCSHQ
ncbi:hypothetical protein BDN71DRAFT_1508727 [Pleurotus eryngii]|uniref:Uncharacterized protein n=1 Tax=Pleurotus eryngii TaxID=5323 RepID=A0A9P6D5B6_PLEER|nr:hypothetical protein BDN71DRAFT_1508727 [Pleurotus eryngii]